MRLFSSFLTKIDTSSISTADFKLMVKRYAQCSTREARAIVPYSIAQKLNVLPLGLITFDGKETLTVGTNTPDDPGIAKQLRFTTDKPIRLLPIDSSILSKAIFTAYNSDEEHLLESILTVNNTEPRNQNTDDSLIDLRKSGGDVGKLIERLIDYAISRSASDIHIIPKRSGSFIEMRIDGEILSSQEPFGTSDTHKRLSNRIKVLARLDLTAKGIPLEGSFSLEVPGGDVHVRVSILPTLHGEKIVLRILGNGGVTRIDELGMDQDVVDNLKRQLLNLDGMIIFGGPTGSGKTTTMYGALKFLENRGLSIATVEDPIECALPFASQTAVNDKSGLTFPKALKTILRQDPDVLLIGEIRDKVSAEIALQASLTGHLVLSTLHIRRAKEAFTRLRQLVEDSSLISQGLDFVVLQALLPELCNDCKVTDLASSNEAGFETFKAVGCTSCEHSGFTGRALAIETFKPTYETKDKLLSGCSLSDLSLVRTGELRPFTVDIRRLLKLGKISLSQARLYDYDNKFEDSIEYDSPS